MTNAAAIGYMIRAMKLIGYSSKEIRQMEASVCEVMDFVTEEEAESTYQNF